MSTIKIIHKRTNKILQYTRGDDSIFVEHDRITLKNKQHKEVFWLILMNIGRTVSHGEIASALINSGRGNADDEPNKLSAKFIHDLKGRIESIPDLENIIYSVRSIGYQIHESWIKKKDDVRVDVTNNFLIAIDNVTNECIEHTDSRRIITCLNGLQYIDFDRSFSIDKYKIIDALFWDTIQILSTSANVGDLIDIKSAFQEYCSYVLYWRFGEGLSESKWKSDYRDEIRIKERKIKSQIRDILENT